MGVTAPAVSATIRSAVSRDSQARPSRQISVTAPGETPMRRAKSARLTPLRLSQSPSFMRLETLRFRGVRLEARPPLANKPLCDGI